jgi:GNAT superfamily N-acetyltransferase
VSPAGQVHYRPASAADLPACEAVWRDGLNDYLLPLAQYEVPVDNPSLRLLHAHCLATDPDRFWVATDGSGSVDATAEPVVAFASAVRRGRVWFLSMLFVQPGRQLGGVGRALLDRVLPAAGDDATLATVTDTAQPISNGLYASLGMVPRLPMFNLVGRPARQEELATLPADVHAIRMGAAASSERARPAEAELASLDRDVLGFTHREDHGFLRAQGRIGFAYRDGRGDLLGYGYASEIGRVGPIATRDAALHAPIVAHLLEAVAPRGASAVWVPGAAAETTRMLVRAGLRMEGFPVLLCWSRPFVDFSCYLPISPGLL